MSGQTATASPHEVKQAVEKAVNPVEEGLQDHIVYCRQQFSRQTESIDRIEKALEESCKRMERISHDTEEIITTWRDIKGAVSIGVHVQKVGLWIVKWPLIGTGLYVILRYFIPELLVPPDQ
jgi:hypothetical protein